MAATTAGAILERFQTVLEAAPLSLTAAGDPFTDAGIPNEAVDSSYRVVHGGMVSTLCQSNFSSARLDRFVVTVQRTVKFDGYDAQQDLQDQLDAIERAVITDATLGQLNPMAEKGSRKITRKKDSDVIEASINFLVDYDFNESA